jgi:hypothetical protein
VGRLSIFHSDQGLDSLPTFYNLFEVFSWFYTSDCFDWFSVLGESLCAGLSTEMDTGSPSPEFPATWSTDLGLSAVLHIKSVDAGLRSGIFFPISSIFGWWTTGLYSILFLLYVPGFYPRLCDWGSVTFGCVIDSWSFLYGDSFHSVSYLLLYCCFHFAWMIHFPYCLYSPVKSQVFVAGSDFFAL